MTNINTKLNGTKSNKEQTCWVPRWQLIKATMNNLKCDDFLQKCVADRNSVILDVRTSDEYKKGHIKDAQNLDYLSRTLAEEIELLDKSKSYYVYCKTGRRSLRICVLLKNSGFASTYNLDNGIGEKIPSLQMTYQ